MQAWQAVKVTNENSGFVGQAGYIVRVEKEADQAVAFVKLDTTDEVEQFDSTELQILG